MNEYMDKVQQAVLQAHPQRYTALRGNTDYRGTALGRWIRARLHNGLGQVRHCGHYRPGQRAVAAIDDPQPMLRCPKCSSAWRDSPGPADDGMCYLCGSNSEVYSEVTIGFARQDIIITGNACTGCYDEIRAAWREGQARAARGDAR